MHTHELLADDLETALWQEMVNIGDTSIGRILHRKAGDICRAGVYRLDRILERAAGQGLKIGARIAAGLMGIGPSSPWNAILPVLVGPVWGVVLGIAFLQLVRRKGGRKVSGSVLYAPARGGEKRL